MTPRLLLFLTPFPPRLDASHGGARATAHVIGALAERHEVALLCLRAEGEPGVEKAIRAKCAYVEEVHRPSDAGPLPRRLRRAARLLTAPLRGQPVWAEAFAVPAFAEALQRRLRAWPPDLVQAEFHVMGQYLREIGAPSVLVEHEPGVPAARERVRSARGLLRWAYRLDLRAWERFERDVLRSVSVAVVFTEEDGRAVSERTPDVEVRRIPLVVPLPEEPLGSEGTGAPTLLFVGNFDHPPNRDAARRLIGEILPAVQARVPEARLVLVGPHLATAWGRHEDGVEITGRVPDVTPYLDAAAVVVAPLFAGGGMRVKVLEALAAGKPVVASPLAVAGLDVVYGRHLLVAQTNGEFVECVVALLRDSTLRRDLAHNARVWTQTALDPALSLASYESLYEHVLSMARANDP